MGVITIPNPIPGGRKGTYENAGAPTVNVTLLGEAEVGDLLKDTANGILYICTATNRTSTIVWTKVGTQT